MRRRSAITKGRSSSMSIVKFLRPPPVRKVLLASSTRSPTSTGWGVTDNMPGLDAGHVQQVADQVPHPVALGLDDADELARPRRSQGS